MIQLYVNVMRKLSRLGPHDKGLQTKLVIVLIMNTVKKREGGREGRRELNRNPRVLQL